MPRFMPRASNCAWWWATAEAQRGECRRWDNLHDLIGSADGKKFRNFVQGLIFDLMIGQANR